VNGGFDKHNRYAAYLSGRVNRFGGGCVIALEADHAGCSGRFVSMDVLQRHYLRYYQQQSSTAQQQAFACGAV